MEWPSVPEPKGQIVSAHETLQLLQWAETSTGRDEHNTGKSLAALRTYH
jgi:hypothetical protein